MTLTGCGTRAVQALNILVLTLTTPLAQPMVSKFQFLGLQGKNAFIMVVFTNNTPKIKYWHSKSWWWIIEGFYSSRDPRLVAKAITLVTNYPPGHYMYIESSSPRIKGETAILQTPWMLLPDPQCNASFYYHMLGDSIGSLEVPIV